MNLTGVKEVVAAVLQGGSGCKNRKDKRLQQASKQARKLAELCILSFVLKKLKKIWNYSNLPSVVVSEEQRG